MNSPAELCGRDYWALVIVSATSCRGEFIRPILCGIEDAIKFAAASLMAETMTKADSCTPLLIYFPDIFTVSVRGKEASVIDRTRLENASL